MTNGSINPLEENGSFVASSATASNQQIKRRKKYTKPATEDALQKLSTYFKSENGEASCQIVDCKGKISRWTPYSLKRHLQQVHPSVYTKLYPDEARDEIGRRVIEFETIQNTVSLLTIHGLPFLLVEKTPFQDLIKPGLEKLAAYGHTVTINRPVIAQEIASTSAMIQQTIAAELKGRVFSVMFDIATKSTISMLGINASLMQNDLVVCRSLGVIQITERHSSENIAKMIQHVLTTFQVTLSQVYTATTDNGSNMICTTRVLNDTANDGFDYEETDNEEDPMEASDSTPNNINNNNERYVQIINALTQNHTLQNEFLAAIPEVRCCAHTIQLAVSDALSKSNVRTTIISRVRAMCKALRNQVITIEYRKLSPNGIFPPLDCPTRWSSVYLMVLYPYPYRSTFS